MTLLQDLRYAARMLWRTRGLTLAAVLSLGLGIGANTTIFAWMEATILQPLPGVAHPGTIVVVASRNSAGAYQAISYLDFKDMRARSKTLQDVLAQDLIAASMRLEGHERAERVYGSIVSGNYFQMLGVKPALGRVFTEADDVTPDAHPVVVISDRIWRTRFNGDPSIVGRTLLMNGRPFTLIGVTPPDFNGTF
ncbi:MAG TPA: ABC transporter permease, partial [Gemmatimonadaceae bacterium]|nr:ABC transporter permease [Gemmatimonadaceae bacterium]